jgi:hypothetical protein
VKTGRDRLGKKRGNSISAIRKKMGKTDREMKTETKKL